eukprot:12704696-Alexandrium_andersonii.AAC.1
MSASLVGSEMCIRDSGAACRPAPEVPRQRLLRSPEGRRRVLSCSRRAVSYTHLTLPTICSV